MKMRPEHFAHLKAEINAVLAKHNTRGELVAEYENGEFSNSEKTKDLQRRFCFDLLYGAGLSKWVCDELYPYLDDSHIYTALRAICPAVTRRYNQRGH